MEHEKSTPRFIYDGTTDSLNPFVDWLSKLINDNWASLRAFCRESGIDPGQLSRQLNREDNIQTPILLKIYGPVSRLFAKKNRAFTWFDLMRQAGFVPADEPVAVADPGVERYKQIREPLDAEQETTLLETMSQVAKAMQSSPRK